MKVIWGKFGTGVDLILCVIINYYVVSIWEMEKMSSMHIH